MTLQGKYYLELYQSPSTNELEVLVHKSKERALKSRNEHTINIIEVDVDELKQKETFNTEREMTAVEFLQDKLSQVLDYDLMELFEQAKEMEQQQLNKAWQEGALTAQSDAAKEIEKNYVSRIR